MLTVSALWDLIDSAVAPLPPVRVPLAQALGRHLAEPVRADQDQPAFSRSAVDGYLVREGSSAGTFRLAGEVRPGAAAAEVPAPDVAWKVFTGSAVPDAGCGLVMVEDATESAGTVTLHVAAETRMIRPRGSQALAGQILLPAGAPINAAALGLLASVGQVAPLVTARPRVVHVVTGREVVPPDQTPAPGEIRDANSALIAGLLADAGAELVGQFRAGEEVEEIVGRLSGQDADVFLISGGVSVGAYDSTAEVLRRLGFSIRSERVASRPGKPLIFSTRGPAVAFGVPGNPLSHFVCFHVFIQRALQRLAGRPTPERLTVPVTNPPPADPRETWWPARVTISGPDLVAEALLWQDSSDLTGLARANALLRVPSGASGETGEVLLFDELV